MSNVKTHQFKVAMTCEGCSGAVERVLKKLKDKGVEDFEIDLPGKTVKVKSSLTSDEVLQVLKKTGKEVEFVTSSA